MVSLSQLPHLIRLLDDDSDVVREQIVHELVSIGPVLENELRRQNITLSPTQQQLIAELLGRSSRDWLSREWAGWFEVRDDKLKLEMALGMIAQFIHGVHRPVALGQALDQLASEYQSLHRTNDVRLLATFLFATRGIAGADQADFYHPMQSSLVHAIEQRKGIPITLASLYILMGHRLGLDIEGCNFPGHFLALAFTKHQKHIVDCYNGGLFLTEQDFSALASSVSIDMKDLFQLECDAVTIVMRILRNLINSYQRLNQQSNVEFISDLMGRVEAAENGGEEEG